MRSWGRRQELGRATGPCLGASQLLEDSEVAPGFSVGAREAVRARSFVRTACPLADRNPSDAARSRFELADGRRPPHSKVLGEPAENRTFPDQEPAAVDSGFNTCTWSRTNAKSRFPAMAKTIPQ